MKLCVCPAPKPIPDNLSKRHRKSSHFGLNSMYFCMMLDTNIVSSKLDLHPFDFETLSDNDLLDAMQ